jgi:hypothetical protein
MINLSEYREAAERHRPEFIRILFLAESPPAILDNGQKSYFFFENNPGKDILFATIIKAVLDVKYRKKIDNKAGLLRQFQDKGFWLIDACEQPINRIDGRKIPDKIRAKAIEANAEDLLERLGNLKKENFLRSDSGIIIIKKVVYNVLGQTLSNAGFRVLQKCKIDFPKYHFDRDTIKGIRNVLGCQ